MAILQLLCGGHLSLGANTEKITIRLTPDQVENIDSIMLNRDIKSRSKVIRMAIENFISENLDSNAQKVTVPLPNMTMNRLIDCVTAGDVLNVESAIQISIDRYLTSISDYYLQDRILLQTARSEEQKVRAERLSNQSASSQKGLKR
jgi:predicted DNA-binding protein